jgi:hypothetical protein
VDGEIEIFTKERDKDGDGKLNKVTVKWTRDSAEKAFGMEWCCKLMWTEKPLHWRIVIFAPINMQTRTKVDESCMVVTNCHMREF